MSSSGGTGAAKPTASTPSPKDSRNHQGISPILAFIVFLLPHTLAAIYSPIQDCDEVYNYWEPTHYLSHGFGFQTWEYSPVYAIRSWAYAGIHAGLIAPFKLLAPFLGGKSAEFYGLRLVLGAVCAACETKLFEVLANTLSIRIAACFMIVVTTSTGFFHSGTAYLPSSFAMYTTMLGAATFMDWRGGIKTAQGIFWFGVGAVLGWPFAAALVLPFLFEEASMAFLMKDTFELFMRVFYGTTRSVIVLLLQSAVDVFFYKKLVSVPWNIVVYNVFSGSSKGPNIYGTEPWHYYIRNLVLNFNIWFPLAILAAPLVFVQHFVRRHAISNQSFLRTLTLSTPFYLWLAIFTLQPHKEERFMYPAYPLLAVNAAVSFHIILQIFGHTATGKTQGFFVPAIKLIAVTGFLLSTIFLSLLRSASLASGYTAPLRVYEPLQSLARPGDTVCIGKEWYRYPSSYFLPDGVRTKFIKSEFAGLLPGEFSEAKVGFGLFPGTWLEPSGMNDENLEDDGKYTDIERCTFLVDSSFPSSMPTKLQPDYASLTNWERVSCAKFLDAGSTSLLGRLFWIPDIAVVPEKFKRKWADYCLLKRS